MVFSEKPCLDHIILLLPYDLLLNPPRWLTENFTITPGGRHADGKTENKLICFQDGSYLELIAFINDDPKSREGHWWGKKEFGIIDFAFTHTSLNAVAFYSGLEERLQSLIYPQNVGYDHPVQGGRIRPDTTEVKWTVTFPNNDFQRGELPFFCHDLTPRSLRVPSREEYVTHPSGVYGIKELIIFVPQTRINALLPVYATLFDELNSVEDDLPNAGVFDIDRVCHLEHAKPVRISLQKPAKDWQVNGLEQEGGGSVFIGELVMASHAGDSTSEVKTDLKASGSAKISVETVYWPRGDLEV